MVCSVLGLSSAWLLSVLECGWQRQLFTLLACPGNVLFSSLSTVNFSFQKQSCVRRKTCLYRENCCLQRGNAHAVLFSRLER